MSDLQELCAYRDLVQKTQELGWVIALTHDQLYLEGTQIGRVLFNSAREAYMFACGFEWGINVPFNEMPKKKSCGCTKQKTGVCWPTCKAKKGKK